ncbi:MAG: hypothetical protein R6X21_10360 [Candidatus Aminicenantes bacterium]
MPDKDCGRYQYLKPTVKTTLYLPEELHVATKIEAAKRRIPMTKLIILGIEQELRKKADHLEGYKVVE